MTERIAFALLSILVFTIPWEKSVVLPGLGTAARIAGALALAAGAVDALRRGSLRPPALLTFCSAAFVIWSAATRFWSLDPAATALRTSTLLQLFLLLYLVWDQCRTRSRQFALLAAYVAGACVASLATIARFATNVQTYYQRFAAPGFDPNDLGITLALAIPVAMYLSMRFGWIYRIAAVLCVAAVLLTASRAGLIASVIAFVFGLLIRKSSSSADRISFAALFALLIAGTFLLAPKASRERIATISSEIRGGTLHKRTTIWKAGLRAWKGRKLTGVGAGAYPKAVEPLIGVPGYPGHEYVAHNTLLSVLVETGLIGFVLYGLCWAVVVTYVLVMRAPERALWLTIILVWAAGASTLTWELRKPSWLIFALVMTEWARAFQPEVES